MTAFWYVVIYTVTLTEAEKSHPLKKYQLIHILYSNFKIGCTHSKKCILLLTAIFLS